MNHYQVRRNLNSSTIITALNYDERDSRLNQGSQQLKTMPHNKINIDRTFSDEIEARGVQPLFKEVKPKPEVTAVLWDCWAQLLPGSGLLPKPGWPPVLRLCWALHEAEALALRWRQQDASTATGSAWHHIRRELHLKGKSIAMDFLR